MTLVNTETGELVESLTKDGAERLSHRISLRLDTIADNYAAVLPLIREAIERQAHVALGYRSPGEYAADRFGDALSKLGSEMRQAVVRELADMGMSSRAIAPVVGLSDRQVRRDVSGGTHVPPAQTSTPEVEDAVPVLPERNPKVAPAEEDVTAAAVETTTDDATATTPEAGSPAPARPPVVGIDGKSYSRPTLVPTPTRSAKQQNADEFAARFAGQIVSLLSMQHFHMREIAREQWAAGLMAASPVQRNYVSALNIRAVADGLSALADEWEDH